MYQEMLQKMIHWYILVTLKKFRCFSAEVSGTALREKTPLRLNTLIRFWPVPGKDDRRAQARCTQPIFPCPSHI